MGLFDTLKKAVVNSVSQDAKKALNNAFDTAGKKIKTAVQTKTATFTFTSLPETVEELKALPEASLDTPFKTAALTVLALCEFTKNRENAIAMLDFLNGPEDVATRDVSFMNDRFMDGKTYVPFSYFEGATPANNYKPNEPFKITVSDNPYSYDNENYAVMYITSGGADNPRQVKLRKTKSGSQWFLWEQFLLSDIRIPASMDKWA